MSDLTRRLRGKTVAEVMTNGHVMQIRTHDGGDVHIAWVNDNGEIIKGKPVCVHHGVRLAVHGLQDLIHLPNRG